MRFVLFPIVAVVGSNPPRIPRESPTVKRHVLGIMIRIEASLWDALYSVTQGIRSLKGNRSGKPEPVGAPFASAADALIQRFGELLEDMKKEEAPSGEGTTASTELQLKLARLYSDHYKFLYSSIEDEQVRGELRQRIYPSYWATRVQYEKMGGDEKFPLTWPQYELYHIANDINRFAQMSPKEQTTNMRMLDILGRDYRFALSDARGIEGLDRAEFDAAGQTLRQLQAQYSRSLNWGSVDNPPPTPKESEVDKRIRGFGGLLENMKKEARSGEGQTYSRELELKFPRYLSDGVSLYSSFNLDELKRMEPPSFGALRRQFHEMGGHGKFPMTLPQLRLYNIVNGINRFAQMSPEEQAANMRMLRDLGSYYHSMLKVATGRAGLDRAEFDKAGQTLRQLQAQYPQPEN